MLHPAKIPMSDLDRFALMARAVELLGLPLFVCPLAKCRRNARCHYFDPEGREPNCLQDLDPDQRALYDAVVDQSVIAWRVMMAGWEPNPTRDPNLREAQDAAVEIAAAVLRQCPANRPLIRRWLRRRDAMPVLEGDALARHIASIDVVDRFFDYPRWWT